MKRLLLCLISFAIFFSENAYNAEELTPKQKFFILNLISSSYSGRQVESTDFNFDPSSPTLAVFITNDALELTIIGTKTPEGLPLQIEEYVITTENGEELGRMRFDVNGDITEIRSPLGSILPIFEGGSMTQIRFEQIGLEPEIIDVPIAKRLKSNKYNVEKLKQKWTVLSKSNANNACDFKEVFNFKPSTGKVHYQCSGVSPEIESGDIYPITDGLLTAEIFKKEGSKRTRVFPSTLTELTFDGDVIDPYTNTYGYSYKLQLPEAPYPSELEFKNCCSEYASRMVEFVGISKQYQNGAIDTINIAWELVNVKKVFNLGGAAVELFEGITNLFSGVKGITEYVDDTFFLYDEDDTCAGAIYKRKLKNFNEFANAEKEIRLQLGNYVQNALFITSPEVKAFNYGTIDIPVVTFGLQPPILREMWLYDPNRLNTNGVDQVCSMSESELESPDKRLAGQDYGKTCVASEPISIVPGQALEFRAFDQFHSREARRYCLDKIDSTCPDPQLYSGLSDAEKIAWFDRLTQHYNCAAYDWELYEAGNDTPIQTQLISGASTEKGIKLENLPSGSYRVKVTVDNDSSNRKLYQNPARGASDSTDDSTAYDFSQVTLSYEFDVEQRNLQCTNYLAFQDSVWEMTCYENGVKVYEESLERVSMGGVAFFFNLDMYRNGTPGNYDWFGLGYNVETTGSTYTSYGAQIIDESLEITQILNLAGARDYVHSYGYGLDHGPNENGEWGYGINEGYYGISTSRKYDFDGTDYLKKERTGCSINQNGVNVTIDIFSVDPDDLVQPYRQNILDSTVNFTDLGQCPTKRGLTETEIFGPGNITYEDSAIYQCIQQGKIGSACDIVPNY